MIVFLDTNVLVDVLTQREPFYPESAAIWTLAEQGRISGRVSVISFTNIHYVVRRLQNVQRADRAMRLLRDLFTAAVCDAQILNQAIDAGFTDFEDAVQYFSAVRVGTECIVTRNPDHFPKGDLPILSPTEFLAAHSFGEKSS